MSKKNQITKNLTLVDKLANFISKNKIAVFDDNTSVVAFSAKDTKLNELNDKLVKNLIKEGKKVLKAQEKNNNNWELTYINPS